MSRILIKCNICEDLIEESQLKVHYRDCVLKHSSSVYPELIDDLEIYRAAVAIFAGDKVTVEKAVEYARLLAKEVKGE
jgi:hypothetical protein